MKKITFAIPDGYVPPEGTKSGDVFSANVTMRLEDDGKKLCLVEVEGNPLPGYEEESEKGQKATEGDARVNADFAARYQTAMNEASGAQQY